MLLCIFNEMIGFSPNLYRLDPPMPKLMYIKTKNRHNCCNIEFAK